jgi:uncharacterized OsmC-like protein
MSTSQRAELKQESGYRFAIRFGPEIPAVFGDEPPPLGQGSGPSPVQLLAAAVANCLSASLVFALRKFKQQAEPVATEVEALVGRNEQNKLRVQQLRVRLKLSARADALPQLPRVLEQFEDFCTVTQSIRAAIPVEVEVRDSEDRPLPKPAATQEALT